MKKQNRKKQSKWVLLNASKNLKKTKHDIYVQSNSNNINMVPEARKTKSRSAISP